LRNEEFDDADALLERLTTLFDDVTFEELQSMFLAWIRRLARVIQHPGEYLTK
jgi:hypothetical protein